MNNLKIDRNENYNGLIAILHTTSVTLPMMKNAISEYLPNARIINFLDDSILTDIKNDPKTLHYAYEKFLAFAKFAERQNADIIVNACSTVGEFSIYATGKLAPQLVRIDDAVTDAFCEKAMAIAVLATATTTIKPSSNLVLLKADPDARVETMWLEEAFNLNASGDKDGHDKAIALKINEIADRYDAIFLAQASMADSIKYTKDEYRDKVYTSIPYCIDRIVNIASQIKK